MISVTRKSHFNAAHRLHNNEWSDEKNNIFYGLCNNKNYHGHNYDLEVTVKGEIDPESGYLVDMKVLSDIIEENICCLLYTSPSPRDLSTSRMPSSA